MGDQAPINYYKIGTIAIIVFSVIAGGYYAYPAIFQAKRVAEVQQAIVAGEPAKAGISEKNLTAAKAALNAIGELESVTNVGINYMQYTSALQSSRIKFDAALRDLAPIDEAEYSILSELEGVFQCHVDAKDAWAEFVEDGDKYGFLDGNNSKVRSLSMTYGFSTTDSEFYKATVLQTIWSTASTKFHAMEERLKSSR